MSEQSQPHQAPRVFMSYSHDGDEHRDWVLALASRLRSNGVDVCLDRWDVSLGGNLALFMERAANESFQVVAVVSETYARKSDEREGGAGVEAQMLSARLYQDLGNDQVIPVIRNNQANPPRLPAFLSGRLWLDFRDEAVTEASYEKLLRDLHQAPVEVAPPLGENPFEGKSAADARLEIRNSPSRWHSPASSSEIEFAYTQNSGRFTIGSGQCQFKLQVGVRGADSVYAYRDSSDIKNVAVVEALATREDQLMKDVTQFDTSSRVVNCSVGDAILLNNEHGYWALVYITSLFERQTANSESVIRFRYAIQTDRTTNLSTVLQLLFPSRDLTTQNSNSDSGNETGT